MNYQSVYTEQKENGLLSNLRQKSCVPAKRCDNFKINWQIHVTWPQYKQKHST